MQRPPPCRRRHRPTPLPRSAAKYRELVAQAEKAQATATGKFSERRKALRDLEAALPPLLSSAGALNSLEEDAIRDRVDALRDALDDVQAIAPSTGSLFVRAFLGQVNVKAASARDRTALRDEYNKFKDRTNVGFIVLPAIWMLTWVYLRWHWRYVSWIYSLTHVWLLYYYCSLSLRCVRRWAGVCWSRRGGLGGERRETRRRGGSAVNCGRLPHHDQQLCTHATPRSENILKVNGSHIRDWWIVHHYVSAIMSITALTCACGCRGAGSRHWARDGGSSVRLPTSVGTAMVSLRVRLTLDVVGSPSPPPTPQGPRTRRRGRASRRTSRRISCTRAWCRCGAARSCMRGDRRLP